MLAMAEELKAKRSSNVSPRKNLITSMIQVIIMIILALSILTFTLSLMLLLPERDNTSDYSKQVAVKFNAFVCLVVPLGTRCSSSSASLSRRLDVACVRMLAPSSSPSSPRCCAVPLGS